MSQENTEVTRILGRYRLLDQLATGGMAVVHLAIEQGDHGLERPVVIKQLQPKHDDETSQRMLLQEARLAARINHPNVVEIHELGTDGARPFIAMEFVPGAQLRELTQAARDQDQPCPVGVAVGIMMQACAGAHAAHELKGPDGQPENLVHRDLSPHNLMVNDSGHVKVLDFGVAKAEFNPEKTQTGVLKGKYAYMSPEQLEARDLDRRSDVFALGIVLWELLAGKQLFGKQSAIRTIHSVLNSEIALVHTLREDVSENLSLVIAKALNRDVELRFQSAAGFRKALQAAATEKGMDTSPDAIAEYVALRVGSLVAERQEWVDTRVNWGLKQEVDLEATTLTTPPPSGASRRTLHTQSTIRESDTERPNPRSRQLGWVGLLAVAGLGFAIWKSQDSKTPSDSSSDAAALASPASDLEEELVLEGEPIRVALAPTIDSSTLKAGWAPIEAYLEKSLGRPVEVVVASDYAATRELLLASEVDFAVLPPMLYIQARQAMPDLRLMVMTEHDDALHYEGVLLKRIDAEVEGMEDLKGRKICYVSKDSTTGYHLPREVLRSRGMDPDALFPDPRFSGSHQDVIRDLNAGLCDLGATTSDFQHDASLLGGSRGAIETLMNTGRAPNDSVCASPDVDAETEALVREALLQLEPQEDIGTALIGDIEKLSGFSRTDDSVYDDIREKLGMKTPD